MLLTIHSGESVAVGDEIITVYAPCRVKVRVTTDPQIPITRSGSITRDPNRFSKVLNETDEVKRQEILKGLPGDQAHILGKHWAWKDAAE